MFSKVLILYSGHEYLITPYSAKRRRWLFWALLFDILRTEAGVTNTPDTEVVSRTETCAASSNIKQASHAS